MIFKELYSKKELKQFNCPNCKNGKLSLTEIKANPTAKTSKLLEQEYYDELDLVSIFSAHLECNKCRENVILTGKSFPEPYTDEDGTNYYTIYKPLFFNPAIHIFKIPNETPDLIKFEIKKSFNLFWTDIPASANKLRIALEILCNHFKINKTFITKNHKRKKILLHNRLELLELKKPVIKDLLTAIKWIGNKGSHFDELKKEDILTAYELFELALIKLFDKKEQELRKKAKQIIKRK